MACETLRNAGYTVANLSTASGTRAERFYVENGWTVVNKNRRNELLFNKRLTNPKLFHARLRELCVHQIPGRAVYRRPAPLPLNTTATSRHHGHVIGENWRSAPAGRQVPS
jgi:hypothetical protein